MDRGAVSASASRWQIDGGVWFVSNGGFFL